MFLYLGRQYDVKPRQPQPSKHIFRLTAGTHRPFTQAKAPLSTQHSTCETCRKERHRYYKNYSHLRVRDRFMEWTAQYGRPIGVNARLVQNNLTSLSTTRKSCIPSEDGLLPYLRLLALTSLTGFFFGYFYVDFTVVVISPKGDFPEFSSTSINESEASRGLSQSSPTFPPKAQDFYDLTTRGVGSIKFNDATSHNPTRKCVHDG